jgi:hypothetical protein
MRLAIVEVKDVLGLRGTINLLENPTLLYGRNLAGKTNIINLIRYCFVLGKAGSRYTEQKRLNKDELLLSGVKDGYAVFYFEHKAKLYKLHYIFRRSSRSVTQKIILSKPLSAVQLDDSAEDAVRSAAWERIAEGARELTNRFAELEIYSDVIDLLISPSNVRNFTDAINNQLVTVPDIIAKQVARVNNGATKLAGNIEKLQGVLVQEKENYTAKFEALASGFREESSKPPESITEIFTLGSTHTSLESELEAADKELSAIPSQEKELVLFKQRWATEFRDKFRRIANAKDVLKQKDETVKQKERAVALAGVLKSVESWNATFKALPSKDNVQGLTDFEVPRPDESEFRHLLNPDRIRRIFDLLKEAKSDLRTAAKIAKKYGVTFTLGEVRSLASSYKKLSKALKSPEERPKGDESIIRYSEDEKESTVYIPVDALVTNPNYLKGVKPTPSVYRSKSLSGKELRKLASEVESKVEDLESCRDKLTIAGEHLDEVRKLVPLLNSEVTHIDGEKKQVDNLVQSRLSDWETAGAMLGEAFGIAPQKVSSEAVDGIGEFISWLSGILGQIERRFVRDLKQAAKSAGIKVGSDFKIGDTTGLDELVSKQSQEMAERRERLQKTKDWLNANLNEVRDVENHLLTIAYVERAAITLDIILKHIQADANLDVMSEHISQNIEETVKGCVEMILPEEMVRFRHVGRGKFLIETPAGEPVTHPAGSHKAVISLGIMLTLSRVFDLPLILDEARDRFDYVTLRNTFQYVDILCRDARPPQVCFVSYRTLDIEKDPDTLNLVRGWNTYLIEKRGNVKTMTRTDDITVI